MIIIIAMPFQRLHFLRRRVALPDYLQRVQSRILPPHQLDRHPLILQNVWALTVEVPR